MYVNKSQFYKPVGYGLSCVPLILLGFSKRFSDKTIITFFLFCGLGTEIINQWNYYGTINKLNHRTS